MKQLKINLELPQSLIDAVDKVLDDGNILHKTRTALFRAAIRDYCEHAKIIKAGGRIEITYANGLKEGYRQ